MHFCGTFSQLLYIIMQPLGTKKITQSLGTDINSRNLSGPKQITQPLRTKKNHATCWNKKKYATSWDNKTTQPLGTTKNHTNGSKFLLMVPNDYG